MTDPAWLRRMGHGPRPALMLHCSLAHSGEWSALGQALADSHSSVAIDLPGHGRAPDHDPGQDIGDEASALARQVLAGMPGPIDLIGHSFGGALALRLAVEAPARIRRLIVIEPTLFAAARAAGAAETAGHDEEMRALAEAVAVGEGEAAARLFTAQWGAGAPWEALPEGSRAYITARIGLISAAEPMLGRDAGHVLAPGRLEAVAAPTLILRGAKSPAIIGAIARTIAARLPDARGVEIAGAGHMLPVTHAPEVNAAISAFLSE